MVCGNFEASKVGVLAAQSPSWPDGVSSTLNDVRERCSKKGTVNTPELQDAGMKPMVDLFQSFLLLLVTGIFVYIVIRVIQNDLEETRQSRRRHVDSGRSEPTR